MKKFDIPIIYRSPLISAIKNKRKAVDKLKKDFSPNVLDFGPVVFYLARHFGFCYGVENAIEIAFKTVEENPQKKIYLLSEMIHNPHVNSDLRSRGVEFLMDTGGKQLIPFDVLQPEDIVVVPAFGTTLEIEKRLKAAGVALEAYNTTCPFVEKVWNRAQAISKNNYTIIVHGKPRHEETRATFSHSARHSPTIIVKDLGEAMELGAYILGSREPESFYTRFSGQYSQGFNLQKDLQRIGVVNQTTMLATDTQQIADYLKQVMMQKYKLDELHSTERFADTRDTLCYATNENQGAVYELLKSNGDLALVIGGYNSSNTSHLVELCEQKLPTYFIQSEKDMVSSREIRHFNYHDKALHTTLSWLPDKKPVKILLTSGASCPDALVEGVIMKIADYFSNSYHEDEVLQRFMERYESPVSKIDQ